MHLLGEDRRAHRHVAARDRLGDRHHVRLHVEMLQREPLAGAPEARDHLIGDQQHLVAVADLAQPREVVGRRRIDPARALHRLGDHRRDRVGAFALDRRHDVVDLHVPGVDSPAARGRRVGRVGVDDVGHLGPEVAVEDFHPRRRRRGDRVAVVSLDARDDLVLLRPPQPAPVEARRLEVGLVRFRARVGEIERLHVGVGQPDHLLGQPNRRLIAVALVGVVEGQCRHLLRRRFAEFRPPVSHRHVPERRQTVDVARPVRPEHVNPLAALNQHRRLVPRRVKQRMHPVVEVVLHERAVLRVVHA